MKRWAIVLVCLGFAVGGVLIASTPPPLDYHPTLDTNPDLQTLLLEPQLELIPGTEKRLVWHDKEQQTEWSVVALHGFSASRQESAPLAELVASKLEANLFETRFSGHGLRENGLTDVVAEDWLDDVAEAFTVGQMIGDKTVVIAISNGAALTLAMLDHPSMQSVDALIFVSPNFGPADPKAMWMTAPGGPLLLRLFAGETRSWEAQNEQQELYWTTSYPMKTLIQVIRVVDRAWGKIKTTQAPRMQIFYSPDDTVISVPALRSALEIIQSPQMEVVKVLEAGSPSSHIIAGDIISPNNTASIADDIADFVLRPSLYR